MKGYQLTCNVLNLFLRSAQYAATRLEGGARPAGGPGDASSAEVTRQATVDCPLTTRRRAESRSCPAVLQSSRPASQARRLLPGRRNGPARPARPPAQLDGHVQPVCASTNKTSITKWPELAFVVWPARAAGMTSPRTSKPPQPNDESQPSKPQDESKLRLGLNYHGIPLLFHERYRPM